MHKSLVGFVSLLALAAVSAAVGCGDPALVPGASEAPEPGATTPAEDADAGADTKDALADAGVLDAAPGNEGGAPIDAGPPTWSNVYANVLYFSCAWGGCHGGLKPSAGLDLSSKSGAYAALVNRSPSDTGLCGLYKEYKLVEPGDHAKSILWTKLSHPPMCGNPMPYGPTTKRLPQWKIDLLAAWIDSGAPNN
jgi:hypothetical protein